MTARSFLVFVIAAGIACAGEEAGSRPEGESAPAAAAEEAQDLEGCELVTRDEVARALGTPVSDGEERGLVGCGWKSDAGAEVVLQVFAGTMLSAGTCNGQKFLISGRQEPVPGLGQEATWGSSGDLVVCGQRAVLKVDVDNTPDAPEKDREVAVAVARAALSRIR